jgi:hypothetical protein
MKRKGHVHEQAVNHFAKNDAFEEVLFSMTPLKSDLIPEFKNYKSEKVLNTIIEDVLVPYFKLCSAARKVLKCH